MPHLHYSEAPAVAPVAVAAGEGAASLFTLLLWGIALSLLLIWRHTIGATFQFVADEMDKVSLRAFGRTRHLLGPVSSALRSADHAVQVALSQTATGAEHATVYLLSQAWHTLEWTAREIWKLGYGVGAALEGMVHGTIPNLVRVGTHALSHEMHAIGRRLTAAELRAEHVIAHKLGAVEWELDRTEDFFRHGIGRVEGKLERLFRDGRLLRARVHEIEKLLAVAAFAGLLVKALERLGLKWLRCPSLLRIGSRLGCGGFGFLESLLFFAWETFAVTDLCRFADGMTKVAEELRPLLMEFVDAEEALVGCHGATAPPDLSVPSLVLPSETAGLKLAA